MKKIFIIMIAAIAISCNKKNSENPATANDNQAAIANAKPGNNDFTDYHNVPAVIGTESISGNMDKAMDFLHETGFAQKVSDPAYTWQYFDSAYQGLPEKKAFYTQQYGYAVLIKKSLLDENTPEAMEKIKFYVAELVKTGYKSYGTLYFALKKLNENSDNKEFIAAQLDKITLYAAKDKQSKDILYEDVSKAPEKMQKHLERVKFNAQFIAKLESLQ